MLVDEKVDTVDVEPRNEAPPRRPFWPVAVFLFGLLVALIGAAFFLDQQYRPRVGVEPVQVAEGPTATVGAPITAPSPTSVPTAPATPSVAPTLAATAAALPTNVATQAPGKPSVVATGPAAAATLPSNLADLLTPLQKEIADAYLRYWDARMRAYYYLDTAPLLDVMAGAELERETQGVEELRAQGRAAKWDVEHNFRVVRSTPDEAEVYDEYVNHSVFLDAATKVETPAKGAPPVRKITFFMKRIDGRWKVVDGSRSN
jgi:hypothetical protein